MVVANTTIPVDGCPVAYAAALELSCAAPAVAIAWIVLALMLIVGGTLLVQTVWRFASKG